MSPARRTALESFERACTLGYGGGCNIVGLGFYEGNAGTKDLARAMTFFERGCVLKHPASCGNEGSVLLERGDVTGGKAKLEIACDGDAASACMELGRLLESGRGSVEADPSRAVTLRKRACRLDGKHCP